MAAVLQRQVKLGGYGVRDALVASRWREWHYCFKLIIFLFADTNIESEVLSLN